MTGRKQKEGLLSKLGDVVVGFERALNSEDARARTAWVRCRTSFERCCQVELGWRFQQALNIDSCIKNAIMGVQQEDTRAKTRWFG